MSKKLFAVVLGERTAGKSTLAGTLPGSTNMIQVRNEESGFRSALSLAKRNGNEIHDVTIGNVQQLASVLEELKTAKSDHVYFDGLSAVNYMFYSLPTVQKEMKNDVWAGYRVLGEMCHDFMIKLKDLTNIDNPHPKNVFLTCAVERRESPSGRSDVELVCQGKMAVSSVTKLGEAILTVANMVGDDGVQKRRLYTAPFDIWPGRIDGLLDDENPGELDPDLSHVLKLLEV